MRADKAMASEVDGRALTMKKSDGEVLVLVHDGGVTILSMPPVWDMLYGLRELIDEAVKKNIPMGETAVWKLSGSLWMGESEWDIDVVAERQLFVGDGTQIKVEFFDTDGV